MASLRRPLSLLATPQFPDRESNRIARILHPVCLSIVGVMVFMAAVVAHPRVSPEPEVAWFIHGIMVGLMAVVLGLVRGGRVRIAAAVFSWGLWCLVTGITFVLGGINSPTIAAYLLVSLLAGFFWGARGVVGFSGLTAVAAGVMLWADQAGWQPDPIAPMTAWYAALVLVTSLVITTVLFRLSIAATDDALVEARGRAREQQAVAELGQLAMGEIAPDELMQQAADRIAGVLEVAYVSVLERRPSQDDLLLRAGVGWPQETIGVVTFPMDLATQAGYTLLNREPVLVADQEREERFPASIGLRGLGVVSSLSVIIPGAEGDEPFGVIGAHATGPRRYNADDIHFLEAVGTTIALALRRHRAQETLRNREEELRHAQKMEAVGRFAGGIAHDFNNLLTAIAGYANFLVRSLALDHPGRADAQEISRVTEQAASLTRQILAFSRRQVLQPEVLDLNDVIRRTESMLRRVMGEDIELETELALDLAPVRADPGQIEQILLNLAVNARDAMPRGGHLSILTANEPRVGREEPRVLLEVRDTGVGMDPETQARAFDPFFTTKERFKGTGLGLSTVYGIAQQSGGSVALDSQLERGTTVQVFLPASGEAPRDGRVRPRGQDAVAGDETVLLAEDEAAVRRLIRRVLDENGYRVLEAGDGVEALAVAKQHDGPIHLVLTDVIMPGMGGGELAERMKHLHPEAKVLYVSGYADDAIGEHGVLSGGEAFLAKPFTFDTLARKVREVLDSGD